MPAPHQSNVFIGHKLFLTPNQQLLKALLKAFSALTLLLGHQEEKTLEKSSTGFLTEQMSF